MSTTPGLRLRDQARTGKSAVFADLLLIALMAVVVIVAHQLGPADADPWLSLYIPGIALACGALGAVLAGPHAAGMLRTPGYARRYFGSIALMLGLDLGIRWWLGGELVIVAANWAALIGSASAVNLLLTRVPLLSARRLIDGERIASFHPLALVIVALLQVAQAWISVLGASWTVALVQLLARRVLILPITHTLARRSYGRDCARRLQDCQTLEYVATRSIADGDGRLIEHDPLEQTVVGLVLLKLPMFAGEAMTAGRRSLTRLGDKLVFLEQMLAFSSPTMVVGRHAALGHIAFISELTKLDDAPSFATQADADSNKARLCAALRDDWKGFGSGNVLANGRVPTQVDDVL